MNVSKNNQPGWVGIGWSLESGYITRHLRACGNPGAAADEDLCLSNNNDDNFSIVLNGVASRLVKVSGALYRLQSDPYWKVEKITSANTSHPDAHRDYWQVTTPDGIRYRFGGEFDVESGADQNSAYVVPIYNTLAAICGNYNYDLCDKAWQWNLDRVEDTNGNVTKYFYAIEQNYYGARTTTAPGVLRKIYTRADYLTHIEYGHRAGVNATPPARVNFVVEERCTGSCLWPADYPDTPGDLVCGSTGTCYENGPTFWSRKRLDYIAPQYYNQSSGIFTSIARFDLAYTFPTPPNDAQGDPSEKKLWLATITQRLGDGTGGLPAATYGHVMLANRAENAAAVSPLMMPRVNLLTTQLGGTVALNYFQSHPCNINLTNNIRRPDDCSVEGYTAGGGGWGLANRWKVQQMTATDTFSGNIAQTTTYAYSAPAWHYADDPALPATIHLWNDFRGSEIVTVTNTATTVKSEHRFYRGMNDDRLNVAGGSFSANITLSDASTRVDDNWLRGREVESRVLTSGNIVKHRSVSWFTSLLTAGSGRTGAYFVAPQRTDETRTDTGAAAVTTRVEYQYDAYGNPTREVRHGDVSTTGDDRTIQRTFHANTTAWIVDRIYWEQLWLGSAPGAANQEKSYVQFAYDNAAVGIAPTKGNVTRVRRFTQKTPTFAYIDTTTTYDAAGRPTIQTDGRGYNTTTVWHAFYGYVTSVTNALSHATQYVNDPGWGVPTRITDPNGYITTLQYDGYGRLSKVWKPTEPTGGVASLEFVYTPTARPAWVKTRQLQVRSTSAYLESWQYVDGFGRELQTQIPVAGGTRSVTHTRYDAAGRLLYRSSPYGLSGAAGSNFGLPTWSTVANYQQYYYDELDRPVKVETRSLTNLLWSEQTSYLGLSQTTIDVKSNKVDSRSNAFGQVDRVTQYIGALPTAITAHATNYLYDVQGNLTQVTDAAGNITSMSYDLLGRKLSMTEPNMGSWAYQYDGNSNLTAQRDGRNLWLHMEYDALNRLRVKRGDTAGTGPKVAEYTYDATGQKGLLSKSISYNSAGTAIAVEVRSVTYDARSRLTRQEWGVTGVGTFRMDYGWNEADARTTLTYPGNSAAALGEVVTHGYNNAGQLTSVVGSGVSYLSSATYNAQGQPVQQRNDTGTNGLTRFWYYEANSLRLSIMRAGSGAGAAENLQSVLNNYDNAGNVTRITDVLNTGQVQCFTYDTLHRLTAARTTNGIANCGAYVAVGVGSYNHTYAYNAIGNITHNNGSAYTYAAGKPHAVSAAFGNSYTYDANGNQVTRTIAGVTTTFVFDRENRLTEVKQGATVLATYVYDADGQRIRGTINGLTTVYLAGVYEHNSNGTTIQYYEGGAMRRSGYATSSGVFYIVQDHLNSSSALVAQNGALSGNRNYYAAWGNNRGGTLNGLTNKRFTGQYQEEAIPGGHGLYYYGARWYDARLARFVSPDTIVPQQNNPQDLNRYSYVGNNPTNFTDPSGHVRAPTRDDGSGGSQRHNSQTTTGWLPSLGGSLLQMTKQYSSTYGLPWPISAGVLEAEIALDTGTADYLETWLFRSSGTRLAELAVRWRGDAGPGIGNIHLSTARSASTYFRTHYPHNPEMQLGFEGLTDGQLAQRLSWDDTNIQTAIAITRMLADYRFGSGGNRTSDVPSNLGGWDMASGIAIWHGYRYGLNRVSPSGQGFSSREDFQNRSLSVSQLVFGGTVQGDGGAMHSAIGALPMFEYYFRQE